MFLIKYVMMTVQIFEKIEFTSISAVWGLWYESLDFTLRTIFQYNYFSYMPVKSINQVGMNSADLSNPN